MEQTQHIPAALWKSLQDICWTQDRKFIQDVSRIIGVDSADVMRRVVGRRGEPNIVLVDKDPWWMGTQCTIMERGLDGGKLWRRCNKLGESNSYCWNHRNFTKPSAFIKKVGDSYFDRLLKRYPVRVLDEIVWVCEKGTVLGEDGRLLDFTIDLKTCVAHTALNDEA